MLCTRQLCAQETCCAQKAAQLDIPEVVAMTTLIDWWWWLGRADGRLLLFQGRQCRARPHAGGTPAATAAVIQQPPLWPLALPLPPAALPAEPHHQVGVRKRRLPLD